MHDHSVMKKGLTSKPTVAHSSGNLKLPSEPPDTPPESLDDPAEVFQALAEGFRMVLAET